ncbi:AMP-binding protein [Reyranella sp.]|jgi:long-chain acyl-CoA synthetase|uniref:AMP-binding protein n=1 Tax=Reyranella sp. TaxID=1929291 RepID=UPI002F9496BE
MHALTLGLRQAVERKPDAQSTSFAPRRRTWRQTADRVGRVAGALATLEVERGDRVAILAQNSDRYFELMYAVAWVGAVLVPINTGLGSAEIEHILADSHASILFIDGTMAHHLTALQHRVPHVREVVWIDDIASPEGMLHYEDLSADELVPDAGASGADLAGLFYDGMAENTAGTALTHGAMVGNAVEAIGHLGFDSNTVYLHASPMFELAEDALTFGVTLAGGRHVFVPRFEPREVLQIVTADKVTHAQLRPDMIDQLLSHRRFSDFDLSTLSAILCGSTPISEPLLGKATILLPGVRLIDAEGNSAS